MHLITSLRKHISIINSLLKPTTMKPEQILQADVLDIIFDNRNKEYGAYELRKNYERRVKKSLLFVLILLTSLVLSSIVLKYFFPKSHSQIVGNPIPDPILTSVYLDKPLPKTLPIPVKRAAQQSYTKPLITSTVIDNPPPEYKELNDVVISDKTISGPKLSGDEPNPIAGAGTGQATENKPVANMDDAKVWAVAEFMPEFPGGIEALKRFLTRNLKMPREDLEAGAKISTLVRFIVDKDGTVTGIEFEKSGGKEFDKEVERVIKKMPTWIPGRQNGRNVAVYFKLPVIFQVPDEN
jgi:periplasmic protein TonB